MFKGIVACHVLIRIRDFLAFVRNDNSVKVQPLESGVQISVWNSSFSRDTN